MMTLRKNLDLFNTIKALAGVNDFTTEEIQNLVDLSNRRLTMAYNLSPMWDRYVVVGEKRSISDFEVDGTGVYDGPYKKYGKFQIGSTGKYKNFYIPINRFESSLSSTCFFPASSGKWRFGGLTWTLDPVTNIVTSSSGGTFAEQVDVNADGSVTEYDSPASVKQWNFLSNVTVLRLNEKQVIPYEETFDNFTSTDTRRLKTDIQDFIRVHKNKSFFNNSSTEFDFYVDSIGANVLNGNFTDNEAYVTYKKPILNDQGKVIDNLTGSANQDIPSEFFNYTAHAVYADFLRMDGQHDKAAFEEQKAEMFLATELERIDIINNNNSLNHKFSTYVNRSTR